MKITIHRNINQIGGCVTKIAAGTEIKEMNIMIYGYTKT